MKVHMIGHASIFVETQDCNILMDPVLWESHAEGIEDICPKRTVIHDNIPEFDLLIISHQHLDHFDIRSLAFLPKNVDVLIPRDKVLRDCLSQLGYTNIYTLKDYDKVKIGSTQLMATRSDNYIAEYGMVFADPSGVFWNQVDSVVSPEVVRRVESDYPQIDFLLAGWQPMLEINYQINESLSFPYSEYNNLLEIVNMIQPKAISPGANGLKFINGSSWLNQIVFPVTREQFCRDVSIICPEVKENIFALDPGDILDFNGGEFNYLPGKSQFVQKLEDDRESLTFSPVNVGINAVDPNTDNYNLQEMKEVVEHEVVSILPKFIIENKDTLFKAHCRWQVIYQLEIIFPDSVRQWHFDFSQPTIKAIAGRNPLANMFTTMTASCLYGLVKHLKGWDFAMMGGNLRSFNNIYMPTSHGIVRPAQGQIEDPMSLKFPSEETFNDVRYQEVKQWGTQDSNEAAKPETKTTMMKMGNTFVRLKTKNQVKKSQSDRSTENLQLASSG